MQQLLFQRLLMLAVIVFGSANLAQLNAAEPSAPKTTGKIERLDPALDKLLSADAEIEIIGEGFKWAEGPVWVPAGEFLIFSDIPNNAIMRWDAKSGVTLYLKPAGYTGEDPRYGQSGTNGLLIDGKGQLIVCQHGDRRLARLDAPLENPQPKFVTLADKYEGKRLNSPNDVIVDSHGTFYFTDPPYGLEKGENDPKKELPHQGVYRLTADGKLTLLTKDLERPNGIDLSPDEKMLYVANSHGPRQIIMAYPLNVDGTLGTGREFYRADAAKKLPGACDGLTVDKQGNVFATIPGGVGVFSPEGKQIGLIALNDPTANCAFGEDGSTLFMTSNDKLLRIHTLTKGK